MSAELLEGTSSSGNSYTARAGRELDNVQASSTDPNLVVLAGENMASIEGHDDLSRVHAQVAEQAGIAASAEMGLIAERLTDFQPTTALEAIRSYLEAPTEGASIAAVTEELRNIGTEHVETSPDANLVAGKDELLARIGQEAFNRAKGIPGDSIAPDKPDQETDPTNKKDQNEAIPLDSSLGLQQPEVISQPVAMVGDLGTVPDRSAKSSPRFRLHAVPKQELADPRIQETIDILERELAETT